MLRLLLIAPDVVQVCIQWDSSTFTALAQKPLTNFASVAWPSQETHSFGAKCPYVGWASMTVLDGTRVPPGEASTCPPNNAIGTAPASRLCAPTYADAQLGTPGAACIFN